MNELHRNLKDQGLQVLAVNLDEKPEDADQFLSKVPAEFMVVADPNRQCGKDFAVEGMPSSYLIDRNGTVRLVNKGFRAGEVDEIRSTIKQLLAEPAR
jgi:peroxiredoxin